MRTSIQGRFGDRVILAAVIALAWRGVSVQWLEPIQVDERDLAGTQARGTQITGMLPFFVIMAVLYGALNAALDTTAGERERGSLEPLLMNPARRGAILGLNSGVTYIALFTGTTLFGLGYARLGFAFCALLSAGCILPALIEARRLRRRSAGGAAAA